MSFIMNKVKDPNKEMMVKSPHIVSDFPPDIVTLMRTPCFDNEHQYKGSPSDKRRYHDYVLKHIDVNNSGMWLEFGVFQGASINYISQKTQKIVYGFDSFEGLPEDWHGDTEFCKKGTFDMGGKFPKVNENVKLISGWFEETLPVFIADETKFEPFCALLHIDCDLYSSTKTVLDLLRPTIKKGTIIMFDEYWYLHNVMDHEYRAFAEFIEESGLSYEYVAHTDRGCASVKIL